jgi:hypothetical protein
MHRWNVYINMELIGIGCTGLKWFSIGSSGELL